MTRRGLALLRASVIALALSSGGALAIVDPEAGQEASALAAQDVPPTTAAPQDGGVPTTAAPSPAAKGGGVSMPSLPIPTTTPRAKSESGSRSEEGDGKEESKTPSTIDFSKMDAKSGELQFEVKVTPPCGTKGTTLTAEVKLPPGSHLSLLVMYADGSNKGEMFAGSAAPDGSFLYPWVIPADAPVGEGKVLVAAVDPATDKSGTNGAPFRVGGTKC